jgi:hypothetical protein
LQIESARAKPEATQPWLISMRQHRVISRVFPAFNRVCDRTTKLIEMNSIKGVKRFQANRAVRARHPMYLELGNLNGGGRGNPFHASEAYDVNAMRTHGRGCQPELVCDIIATDAIVSVAVGARGSGKQQDGRYYPLEAHGVDV